MMMNRLEQLICGTKCSRLIPKAFHIADNGVPVLFMNGFTTELMMLMQHLKEEIPSLSLNPIKKWSKVTLGALKDEMSLEDDQIWSLRNICIETTKEMKNVPESKRSLTVKELKVVIFGCRSLEQRLNTTVINLSEDEVVEELEPSSQELIESLLNEPEKEPEHYLHRVKPLDSTGQPVVDRERESYYRDSHVEATLVFDLPNNMQLCRLINNFRNAVDNEFPEFYAWFDCLSRHITVSPLKSS